MRDSDFLHILNCERAAEASYEAEAARSIELLVKDWADEEFKFVLFGQRPAYSSKQEQDTSFLVPRKSQWKLGIKD